MLYMRWGNGFTLLEVLLVIVIAMILLAVSIFTFYEYREKTDLDMATERVLETLFEARAKTLSSENRSPYSVHFQGDKAIIFKGSTFNASDTTNIDYVLPPRTTIATISLAGGGNDIIFKRLTGETNQSGTVTLQLVNTPSSSTTISIASTGLAKKE